MTMRFVLSTGNYFIATALVAVTLLTLPSVRPASANERNNLLAYRAAKIDALRNLGEEIYGLRLDSQTTVENYTIRSDRIKSRLDMVVQGAREVAATNMADGSVEVTVEITLSDVENIFGQRILYDQVVITARGYGVAPRDSISTGSLGPISPQMTDGSVLTAQGFGLPPMGANLSSAEQDLLGYRAAQADAMRNLAEALNQVRVTATTTVQDYAVTNDTIRTRIQTRLQGARVVNRQRLPDGRYLVELALQADPSELFP